jgi:hypothetical protein
MANLFEYAFLASLVIFGIYVIYLGFAYWFNLFPFPPSSTWDPTTGTWVTGNPIYTAARRDADNLCQTGWMSPGNICGATPTDSEILNIYNGYL